MATAFIEGLLESGFPASQIYGSARSENTQKKIESYGVNFTNDNKKLAKNVDIIVFSVKPNTLLSVIREVRKECEGKHIISIVAGTSLDTLENEMPGVTKIFRAMPNICSTVLKGTTAIAHTRHCTEEDIQTTLDIFSSVGISRIVPENLMDAVTGLSGSGPAYIFQIIEAMSDGAVHEGLDRKTATEFAAQTVLGAAEMVLKSDKSPGELKDMVCSPGGTTIEGVRKLEESGGRAAFMNAVIAASEKSKKMNKK